MTRPEAVRYLTTTRKSCIDALKRRGSLLIWRDKDVTWLAPKAGRNGRPLLSSDAATQLCLMVKVLPGLPLRQRRGGWRASYRWLAPTGRCLTFLP